MRNNLRNVFNRFLAAGIGDAKKRARYSDDIQLVSIVDDFRTGAPVSQGTYGAHFLLDTTSGNFPTLEIQAGANGLWLMAYATGSLGSTINTWTIPELTPPTDPPWKVGPFQVTMDAATISFLSDGRPPLARMQHGGRLKPDIPTQRWRWTINNLVQIRTEVSGVTGTQAGSNDIWLAPGRVLVFQHEIGADRFGGILWREFLSSPEP